jgi:hypothetical protein
MKDDFIVLSFWRSPTMAQPTVTIVIDSDAVVRYYVGNTEITKAQALAYQQAGAQVVKASQDEGKRSPYSGHDNSTSDTI